MMSGINTRLALLEGNFHLSIAAWLCRIDRLSHTIKMSA